MSYLGHWRIGGAEVVNHERLAAYVANGIKPPDTEVTVHDSCDGLGAAIDGTGPYRTPIVDGAPWVDQDNPDTFDFAGVMVLEATGVDDTTRTVEMNNTVRDGALPGRARRGPRTIGVTSLLIGSTTEGVNAGLAWLQRVLSGDCAGLEAQCGPDATLEFMTSCPGPLVPTVDLDSPTATTSYNPVEPADGWQAYGGSFDTEGYGGIVLFPYDAYETIDAGESDTPEDTDPVDGGGAGTPAPYIDGGTADVQGSAVVAAGAFQLCNDGPVTISWILTGYDGPDANVQLVIVDQAGQPVEYGPKEIITPVTGPAVFEWELPFGVGVDGWRPGLVTDEAVTVGGVSVTAHGFLTPLDCVNPYRRLLPRTVTTSGPTVTNVIDMDCVQILQVEWVWVVGSPYRYSPPEVILSGLSLADDPTLTAPGVTYGRDNVDGTEDATPWNCSPPVLEPQCSIDPCAPGFGTPPALPTVPSSAASITTQDVYDMWVCVSPDQVPANDGVFTFTLFPDAPIVGARVRVYDTALGDCSVPDVCDFAYEYLIDYIPDGGVFTINGMTEGFTTLCDGGAVLADAGPVVRGDYGGPTKAPVARCDRRYFVRVQWLGTYPRSCVGLYEEGDPQGDITLSLSVASREG